MAKKILFGLLAAGVVTVIATINLNLSSNKKELSDLFLANVEALARNEGGESGEKICYFKGVQDYTDWYECTSDYPNVGGCGNTNRLNKWFSKDKHVCN